MNQNKTLEMLTIKDNFLFGAVMSIEENCKGFLELSLGFPIERVTVSRERNIVYHPEYKGIRLDVFAKDENHTRYNVEMQVAAHPALGKRARYYHSQIDMELLRAGQEYTSLPDTYVIFICDFDPFSKAKYCYTFQNCCLEQQGLTLCDGCHTIFLSTCGINDSEVSENLVTFLKFVKAGLQESTLDFGNPYIKSLQNSIQKIKNDREMGERYMVFQEMLADEHVEGRIEGTKNCILYYLQAKYDLPENLKQQILSQQDEAALNTIFEFAVNTKGLNEFLTQAEPLLDPVQNL